METRILMVRHGESLGNAQKLFCCRMDVPLTEKGLLQAKVTAGYLTDCPIDMVYASPLERAYRTGEEIAQDHGLPVQKDEGLMEIWGGEWEGKTFPEIMELYPEDRQVWNENIGLCRCTGGESVAEVQERVYAAVERLAQKHPGKTLLLATHAMATRSFIAKVKGLTLSQIKDLPWPTNASVTELTYEGGVFRLVEYSHDAHLKGLITDLPSTI